MSRISSFSNDSRLKAVDQKQFPYLPMDVIYNIFSRLPVKSLMRFRCVSKTMDSIISDTQFVKLHLCRALEDSDRRRVLVTTDPPRYILFQNLDQEGNNNQGQDVSLPIDYPPGITSADVEIIGSCNGLLCFMLVGKLTENETYNIFILWNPSTRAFRELDEPGLLVGHLPDIIVIYGFGYDQVTDDYKIIRAVSPHNGTTSTELEIYSLKQNAWQKIQASLPCILSESFQRLYELFFPGLYSRGNGVFSNGAVHWLQMHTNGSALILSFNMATERFEEAIPLLDYNKNDSSISELQVLGGHLSVLVHKPGEIEIWVMKKYGIKSSWTNIATMPEDPGPEFEDIYISDWIVPISLCRNGCMLVDMDGCQLSLYNPQEMSFRKINLGGGDRLEMFLVREVVESLVSPLEWSLNEVK